MEQKRKKKLLRHLFLLLITSAIMILCMSAVVFGDTGTRTVSSLAELQSALSDSAVSEIIVPATMVLPDGTNLDGAGKTVRVETPYLNADGTNADAPSQHGVFSISSRSKVTIENMTLMGGGEEVQYSKCPAIKNEGGILTLRNVVMTRSNRGLINSNAGIAILENCSLIRNSAAYGAGLLNESSCKVLMDGCSFTENIGVYTRNWGGGGAAENQGYMYLNNTVMSNNINDECGAAINNYGGALYIMNSTITGNAAIGTDNTGALRESHVYVVNSILTDNVYNQSMGTTISASDVNDGGNLYYCVVGQYNSTVTTTNCVTENVTGANVFASYENAGLFLPVRGQSTAAFNHTVLAKTGSRYYSPILGNGKAATGGVDTYFGYDLSGTSLNVKMSYKVGETETALQSLATGGTKVDTYIEGGSREAGVIGASGAADPSTQYYTVTLSGSVTGGHVEGATIFGDTYESGTPVTVKATPDSGKKFHHWKIVDLDNTGSEPEYISANPYTFNVNRNVVLTPEFVDADKIYVRYDPMGGSGSMDATEVDTSSTNVSLSENKFSKDDAVFQGWDTDPAGTTVVYQDKASITTPTTDDLTLYAVWKSSGGGGGGGTQQPLATILTSPVLEDLTYNGADQKLVKTAGVADHGTLYYKVGDGDWTADITGIKAKEAGRYKVSWYLQPEDGYASNSSATEPADSVYVIINKAPLTVTADNKGIYKDDEAPTYTATYSDFVGGETVAVLGGELKFLCTYDKGDIAGDYVITPFGVTADNYAITFVNGKLTVSNKGTATVEAPVAKDLTYSGADQELVTVTAATNGTTYYRVGSGTWSKEIPKAKDAGKYTVSWYVKPNDGYISESSGANPAGSVEVTIKKTPLTVTAENKRINKDDEAPAYTATYTGFVGDPAETAAVLEGELKFTCSYNQGDAVGTYDIVPSGYTSGNYSIQYVKGTLTVANKGTATVEAPVAKDLTYSGADQELVTITAATNGTAYYRIGSGTWSTEVPKAKDAGKYTVSWYVKPNDGYSSGSSAAEPAGSIDVTIKKAALTVKADNKSIYKDDEAPTYTATYIGFVGDPAETVAVLEGELKFTCSYKQGDAEGTYDIVPGGYTSENYSIQYVKGTLTVANKGTAFVDDPTAKDLTYSGADQELVTVTAATNGTAYYRVGSGTWSTEIPKEKDAGKYTVSWYVKPNDGYSSDSSAAEPAGSIDVTIKKAALTVTAKDERISKDADAPAYALAEGSPSGFVGGETVAVLAGELKFTCSYKQGDAEGTYDIVPSGYTSENYSIQYVKGTLTVENKGTASVADPEAKDLTYSGADQELVTVTAATNGTAYYRVGSGTWSTEVPKEKDAGKYTVSWYVKPNDGYSSDSSAAEPAGSIDVTIKKAPLTVTAENKDINKDDEAPTYTATYSGFVGEPKETEAVLGGELKFLCSYDKGDVAGIYVIIPFGLTSENYAISFVNGTLTVANKGTASVADPEAKDLTYSGADQELVTVTAATNGNTYYRVGGSTWSTEVPKAKDAGKYTVSWYVKPNDGYISDSSAAEPAGSIDVTIKKAPLTVTAENKEIKKDAAAPEYTATYTGFVGDPAETVAVLGGELKFTCTYNQGDDEGTYDIVPSGYTSENYSIQYVKGTLTVGNSGTATVEAPTARDLTYSGAAQALVDIKTATNGTAYYRVGNGTWTTTAPSAKEAGKYTVSWYVKPNDGYISDSSAAEPAGSIDVTIKKKEVTLTWDEQVTYTYDGEEHIPGVQVGTGVAGETLTAVLTGSTASAGKHTANVTGLRGETADNYKLPEETSKVFEIQQAELEPTLTMASWNYGDKAPSPVLEGNKGGGNITFLYSVEGEDNWAEEKPKDQGSYTVKAVIAATTEYAEKSITANFSIAPRIASIEWTDLTFRYDGEEHVPTATVANLVKGDTCDVTVVGAQVKAGRRYTAEATALSDPNYELPVPKPTQEFVITKGTMDPEPVVSIAGWTYGDEPNEPVLTGNISGGNVSYTYAKDGSSNFSDKVPTDAGAYILKASIEETEDGYEAVEVTTQFVISQRTASLAWKGTSLVYTGAEQVPSATVTNQVDGDNCEVTVEGSQTNAGEYVATAAGLSDDNYKLPDTVHQTFIIAKALISYKASGYFGTRDSKMHGIQVKVQSPEEAELLFGTSEGKYDLSKSPTYKFEGGYTVYYQIKAENYVTVQGKETVVITPKLSGEVGPDVVTNVSRTRFARLKARSEKQTKTSITLNWNKLPKAKVYVVYGNKCNSKGHVYYLKRLGQSKGTSFNAARIAAEGLKKGTMYKFVVIAYDEDNKVIEKSAVLHVATKGGKCKNYKGIKVKAPKSGKVVLTKGKTFKIKARAVGKKVKKHVGLRYESSNASVASVTSKGVIQTKKPGKCTVYVYTQNGKYKNIAVTVQ